MEVLVEDLDVRRALNIAGRDRGGATNVETHSDGFFGQASNDDIFQVQDDVGDVFSDTADRVEFVQSFVEADRHDGGAGNRREESATE